MNGKARYLAQIFFQRIVTNQEIDGPTDSPLWFQYHVTSIIEELGELLKADKRWKTHRNTAYNREEKLEEYADAAICLMNIGIFSGFTYEEIEDAIKVKQEENIERIKECRRNEQTTSKAGHAKR